jgi:UDP-N-acetylglucosamine 1-carboxyvinyltransferase
MHPAEHTVLGDRIEAGTFLIAGAVTGGEVEVTGISPHVLDLFLSKLRSVGVQVYENTRSIRVSGTPESYVAADVATLPYPGFPTDLQAQMMVLLSVAGGVSMVTENVFENRFGFVDELIRLGADIRVDGNHAVVTGGRSLTGAIVRCPDLRAGAALAIPVWRPRDHRTPGYLSYRPGLRAFRGKAADSGRRRGQSEGGAGLCK